MGGHVRRSDPLRDRGSLGKAILVKGGSDLLPYGGR